MMKTREEYIALLKDYLSSTASHYGVGRIGIYGSVSRNEQDSNSDIDIIYEGKADIFLRIRMKKELEHLLGCKVDIIRMSDQLTNSPFGKNISKDLVYV